ncbi:diguanylate cyclase [Thermodesulfobacteriota bacterium]
MKQKTLEEFERLKRQISIFNEIGKTLTATITIKEVLEQIFYKVAEFFSPENWSLLLVDEDRQELYFEIVVGDFKHADKIKDIRLKLGEGVAGWVAKTGRPLFVPSVDEEPHFTKRVDAVTQFSTESIVCIPLKIREKVLGVIELINKKDITPLHHYDIEILNTVADYAAIALENAMNYEHVRKLTITDDTSGLYNSRYLHKLIEMEIERCKEERGCFSVIFFDLDYFKQVNDTHGHLVGSRLLGEVGRLVADELGEDHAAARYGGDEFVIILPEVAKEAAVAFCKKMKSALDSTCFFAEEGLNIKLTASFGIATFPEDAGEKNQILHAADERMYRVKEDRKNDIAFS